MCPPTQIQCPHPEQADIITQGTVTDAFAVVEVDWDPKCRLKFKVPQHVNKDWRSATCFTVTGSLTELTESHPHAPGPGERQRRPPAHLVDDAPAPAQKAKAKPKPKPVNLDAPDAQKAKAKGDKRASKKAERAAEEKKAAKAAGGGGAPRKKRVSFAAGL